MSTGVTPVRPKVRPSPRFVKLNFDTNGSKTRVLFRIAGTALIIGSATMWVVPDLLFETQMVPVKFGGSLFFLLCGLALLMRNHVDALPEVQFDPRLREMRVLQKDRKGEDTLVLRRSYDSIGAVYVSPTGVELWNKDGTPLLSLPVADEESRRSLREQFGELCA
ncbi:MAG: hypothetical protein ACWA5A_02150 [Marinibacterium sp.]